MRQKNDMNSYTFNKMNTKTAVITGASTGIGKSLAFKLAQEGYALGLIARRGDLLEKLKQDIETSVPGTRVLWKACDVVEDESFRHQLQSLVSELGQLDLFIANAGVGVNTPGYKSCWPSIKSILDVNVVGAISSLEAAKEIMLRQKSGHLVGISSVAAVRGLPGSSAYCCSKAALSAYLESIRIDLKLVGISVTSIHPGFIATPMTAKNNSMPFLLSADQAALIISKTIQKKKARKTFPWPMLVFTWILRFCPDALYDAVCGLTLKKGVFR